MSRHIRRLTMLGALVAVVALVPATVTAQVPADARALVEAHQQIHREVAQQVLPVVVELETVENVTVPVRRTPSPFEFFFGRPDPREESGPQEREYEQRGIGSGIIVRRNGDNVYILTNNHVAGEADRINITLYDGRTFEGSLVGADPNKDLALVVFETDQDIPIARLGNSDHVQVGDFVLAVGNPLGFESTLTSGIVSAIGRRAPNNGRIPILTDYIQTDAAINRGNSGGPLVNLDGEVVGMNTWIASQTGGSIGIGFAIPINNASQAIDQFIATGRVEYGWLGVNMSNPPHSPSDSLDESRGGAFVYSVFTDSPADDAGILPGDIIIRVNRTEIEDDDDLLQAVTGLVPGSRNTFVVRREGRVRTIMVETGARPDSEDAAAALWPGLSVVEITDEIRDNLDVDRGDLIISQVAANGPAATAGLRSGDIVLRVNNEPVSNLREFYAELNGADDDEVVFRIRRDDTNLIIGLVK